VLPGVLWVYLGLQLGAPVPLHMWRIADDKVIEHWANRDDLGQLMQLGLIPGPPAST